MVSWWRSWRRSVLGRSGRGAASRRRSFGSGAVYTLSNEAGGINSSSSTGSSGGLSLAGTVATGGWGWERTGKSGITHLSARRTRALCGQRGQQQHLRFRLGSTDADVIQITDSAGLQPISLTAREDTLYVLNNGSAAGDVDQITGFTIHQDSGRLSLLHNSTQGLSSGSCGTGAGGVRPRTARFWWSRKRTPIRLTRSWSTATGRAGGAIVQPSSGMTPYGFAFSKERISHRFRSLRRYRGRERPSRRTCRS